LRIGVKFLVVFRLKKKILIAVSENEKERGLCLKQSFADEDVCRCWEGAGKRRALESERIVEVGGRVRSAYRFPKEPRMGKVRRRKKTYKGGESLDNQAMYRDE